MVEPAEMVIDVVISLIFIALGVIIAVSLYPMNPFIAIAGLILLTVFAVAAVYASSRSHTQRLVVDSSKN